LRQCRSYEDYYHFEQELLERVLAVQQHRSDCTRAARLLRKAITTTAKTATAAQAHCLNTADIRRSGRIADSE
jgi:hypothetical protein